MRKLLLVMLVAGAVSIVAGCATPLQRFEALEKGTPRGKVLSKFGTPWLADKNTLVYKDVDEDIMEMRFVFDDEGRLLAKAKTARSEFKSP